MSNIIETIKNKNKIMADQNAICPACGTKQFSPFDKLYASAYGKCVNCSTPKELEDNGNDILAIVMS